jgi:hypothetical protein
MATRSFYINLPNVTQTHVLPPQRSDEEESTVKIIQLFKAQTVCAIAVALALVSPFNAWAGTSCADCGTPSRGAFSIGNDTGSTIHYSIKWGNGDWQKLTVANGYRTTSAHELNGNDQPYVRFDYILNDNQVTEKVFHVESSQTAEPMRYKFVTHGQTLGLMKELR